MYELSRHLPNELIYKRKNNLFLGFGFLIIGVIGELIFLYIFFLIINLTSFVESSFLLNLIASENIPFSFFISLFGSFCLVYASKELFFINGWKVSRSNTNDIPSFNKFWKFLFLTSNKIIHSEDIKSFTINYIYYDELRTVYRKRLQLDYQGHNTLEKESILLFEELNSAIESKISQIIKDFFTVMQKEFPIIKKEINSKVVET